MAQFEPMRMLKRLTGRMSGKSQVMMRRKQFRLPDGKVIAAGPHEAYLKERRDYKRHPLTEGERRQREKWTAVCREASVITHDPNHPCYAALHARWQEQLTDPSKTVHGKPITLFGNYVRSVLLREGR